MKVELVAIRHGQTTANQQRRIAGILDVKLTDQGKAELEQMKQLSLYSPADAYYTSQLTRTQETLRILFGDVSYEICPEFNEVHFGIFEDQTFECVEEFYQYFMENNHHAQGEVYQDVFKRVNRGIHYLLQEAEKNQFHRIVLVAHNGVLRMVYAVLMKLEKEHYRQVNFKNGKGFKVQIDVETQRVEAIEMVD